MTTGKGISLSPEVQRGLSQYFGLYTALAQSNADDLTAFRQACVDELPEHTDDPSVIEALRNTVFLIDVFVQAEGMLDEMIRKAKPEYELDETTEEGDDDIETGSSEV